MKVGTDGVLLGAWAPCSQASRILDIGSGTGVIALMMAQRNSRAIIDAIEISSEAYGQMLGNFERSAWGDRLNAIHTDFLTYSLDNRYDLIISNPPFFSSGVDEVLTDRQKARHASSLPMQEFLQKSFTLLSEEGVLALVIPFELESNYVNVWKHMGGTVSHVTRVCPNVTKSPRRSLLLLSKKEEGATLIDELAIELGERHHYTDRYLELTSSFYLGL